MAAGGGRAAAVFAAGLRVCALWVATRFDVERRMMSEEKPILCLDFDGVLHSYVSGWKGAHIVWDPPVPGAQQFVTMAKKYFRIVVFSSRSLQEGGIRAMTSWMQEHGFPPVEFATEKPPAMITIDDRAITFTGTWPAIDELREFKPWNKGKV